jgi:hypothetical protein
MREEHRLMLPEDRVLRRKEEEIGGGIKLH